MIQYGPLTVVSAVLERAANDHGNLGGPTAAIGGDAVVSKSMTAMRSCMGVTFNAIIQRISDCSAVVQHGFHTDVIICRFIRSAAAIFLKPAGDEESNLKISKIVNEREIATADQAVLLTSARVRFPRSFNS
jgi:hypothetical protein